MPYEVKIRLKLSQQFQQIIFNPPSLINISSFKLGDIFVTQKQIRWQF